MRIPVDQLVGTMIGKYDLTQLIGQGRLSTVYMVRNHAQDRFDMLTFFHLPESCVGLARERFMTRFVKEAVSFMSLRHPHIVPLHDFGEYFDYPYLVTPLHTGESLAALLQREGRCSLERMMSLLRQFADALDSAHSMGFVHGSLKPSNLLLVDEPGGPSLRIAGFGLNTMLAMNGVGQVDHAYPHLFSIAGTMLANPMYLAPEVVMGIPADVRSDIYALGVIIFEMLCGRPPFVGTSDDPMSVAIQHVQQKMPSLQFFAADLPQALNQVLQRVLEHDPARRLASAGEVVRSFEQVVGDSKKFGLSALMSEVADQAHSWEPSFDYASSSQDRNRLSAPKDSGPLKKQSYAMPVSLTGGLERDWKGLKSDFSSQSQQLLDDRLLEQWSMSSKLNAVNSDDKESWRSGAMMASVTQRERNTSALGLDQPVDNQPVSQSLSLSPSTPGALKAVVPPPRGIISSTPISRQPISEPLPANPPVSRQPVSRPLPTVPPAPRSLKNSRVPPVNGVDAVPTVVLSDRPSRRLQRTPIEIVKREESRALSVVSTVRLNPRISPAADTQQQPSQKARTPKKSSGPEVISAPKKSGRRNTSSTPAYNRRSILAGGMISLATILVGAGYLILEDQNHPSTNPTNPTNTNTNAPVIGHTNLAENSASLFNETGADQRGILIHLSNGTFVAYDRTCTDQQALVNYDPLTGKLVCPLHHAIFDPAKSGVVVKGPALEPLAQIIVRVNADGTITSG